MSEKNTKDETRSNSSQYGMHDSQRQKDDEIDLRELYLILKSQRYFIGLVMLVVLFLAGMYALTIPPNYETTALVQVDNKTEGNAMLQGIDSTIGGMMGRSSGAMISQIESALLSSRFILEPTIEKLGLSIHIAPNYFPIIGSRKAQNYDGESVAKPFLGMSQYAWGGENLVIKYFDAPREFIGKEFKLVAGEHGQFKLYNTKNKLIIEGVVGSEARNNANKDNEKIKIFVSELKANEKTEFYITPNSVSKIVKFLSKNLRINDLGVQERDYFGKNLTGILNISLKGSNATLLPKILNTIIEFDIEKNSTKKVAEAQKTLAFLEKQSVILKGELDKAETALSNYQTEKGTVGIELEQNVLLQTVIEVEKNYETAKLKRAELLQEYTPLHPFIVAIDEQIKALAKEKNVLGAKVKTLPKSEQKILSLQRDVKVKDQLYLLLLNRIQQLQITRAGMMSDIRILGFATPAVELPSKRPVILFGSLILGFIIATIIIFLRQALNRGVNDPDYIEERLGIPMYAIIPHSKRQMELAHEMKRKIPGGGPYVLAAVNQKDLALEGLRSLRTTLQFGLQDAKNNIISILGSSPSIGKSFTSTNLAYIFSDSGKKVLLIDADMRRGRIASYVSHSNSPGLADLLTHQTTFAKVCRVLKPDSLDFVPTGKYPTNPSELLFGDTFKNLLEELSPKYDVIIVDTPPILAVTDGILIAKLAAINLLLLGFGLDNLRGLEHTVKRIYKNDIKINGLIFNNTKDAKQGYYGKYYGRYGYSYNYYYYDYSSEDKDEKTDKEKA